MIRSHHFAKILIALFTVLTSCVHQTSINKRLTTVKKSFIQIEVFLVEEGCELASCSESIPYSSASGAVVLYNKQRHILTAAHVCNANNDIFGPKEIEGYKTKFVLKDRSNRKHEGKIIKVDFAIDSCLIYSESIKSPALTLSPVGAAYGEKVYNVSAPLSIAHKNMVLVFEGMYSGNTGPEAFYTIPTAFGSSGSPIINANGKLIGMIHSVHLKFHHVSLSPTHSMLWNFLAVTPNWPHD